MKSFVVLVSLSLFSLASCSNGTGTPDGAAGTSGSAGVGGASGSAGVGGTSGAAGSGGASGTGGAGGSPACASAVATQPCSVEGTVCGGDACTNVCQFCNLARCTNGVWQRIEVAPVPCFACGTAGTQCQSYTQYCEITIGGVPGSTPSYRCPATPASCQSAPTCACLQSQGAPGSATCSQGAAGQLTITLAAP